MDIDREKDSVEEIMLKELVNHCLEGDGGIQAAKWVRDISDVMDKAGIPSTSDTWDALLRLLGLLKGARLYLEAKDKLSEIEMRTRARMFTEEDR